MSKQVKTQREIKMVQLPLLWLSCIVSIGLLLLTSYLFLSDVLSFRSCNKNASMTVTNCGKVVFTIQDLLIILLFMLSAISVVTLIPIVYKKSWSKDEK